jgi:hypothetical protein
VLGAGGKSPAIRRSVPAHDDLAGPGPLPFLAIVMKLSAGHLRIGHRPDLRRERRSPRRGAQLDPAGLPFGCGTELGEEGASAAPAHGAAAALRGGSAAAGGSTICGAMRAAKAREPAMVR